ASPLACTSFRSPQSPVSVSSQLTCCQLGWKSHPIIIIAKAPFFPSVFVLKQRLPGFESSLRSYPINPCVFCKGGRRCCMRYLILLWTRNQTDLAPAFPTPAPSQKTRRNGHPLCL